VTRTLVLFAKPPLPGVAKTRLAAELGPERAALVAAALLADSLALAEGLTAAADDARGPVRLVLAYTEARAWFEAAVADRWELLAQTGADLGERLEKALGELAPADDDATVFIGMDAPHLPRERLHQAFAMLEDQRTVLGPCDDGGYYLLGVRGAWPPGVLGDVRWSTAHAFKDTLRAFLSARLTCAVLAGFYDVDDLAQLRRLGRDLGGMPADTLPHSRAALREVGLA